jgi:hypothetical protein
MFAIRFTPLIITLRSLIAIFFQLPIRH